MSKKLYDRLEYVFLISRNYHKNQT